MKVQLIVVRGKPEGKVIPLAGPTFKIGRGEGCHLRPNSDQVSREHVEFTVANDVVMVHDLKSRNGTQVNGKPLVGSVQLKDRDLVQVGPLTFAVSIQAAPATAKPAAPAAGKPAAAAAPGQSQTPAPAAAASRGRSAPEEVLGEDIDQWLVGAPSESSTEIPTSVYGGETVTIATYQGGAQTPPADSAEENEDEEEDENEDEEDERDEEDDDENEDEEDEDEAPVDEFIDESNPFHAAKKAQQQAAKAETKPGGGAAAGAAGQQFQDTSGAANEILRKLRERKRTSR